MSSTDTPDQVDVIARLLRNDWIAEIDAGVQHLIPVIKRIFRPDGLLGFIADPFIDLAAVTFLRSSRKIGIKQMDVTIQCAKEAISTGALEVAIAKHVNAFVELDEMHVYGQKSHPGFKDLEASIRAEFALRAEETSWLLAARPSPGQQLVSAPDVYKAAYNNDVEKARKVHAAELGFIEDRLRMVREHEGLISIPFGLRDKVLQVVSEGLQFTKQRYAQVFTRWFA
ncbi:MAG: hypothetical protein GYA24_16810 [Candidatus Lokiarchaeota archaeon]|nr:hypothetical protein [Candidatus Lokiarchaeota archaeon]